MKHFLALATLAALATPSFAAGTGAEPPIGTSSVLAYEAFVEAREHLRQDTADNLAHAYELLQTALEEDPDYGEAHAALALVYYTAFQRGWNRSIGMGWNTARLRSGKHMMEARKDPTALMHRVHSEMMLRVGRTTEALESAKAGIALDPNDTENMVAAANALIFLGRSREALDMASNALERDPHFPARYLYLKGLAAFGLEEFTAAVAHLETARALEPDNHRTNAILAAALGHLGEIEAAKRNFDTYVSKERNDTAKGRMDQQAVWMRWPYTEEADWSRLAEGLALASGKELPASVETAGTMNENAFFEYMLGGR